MILHEFTFDWDGKSQDGQKPVAWFPGSFKVRIVHLGDPQKGIKYLFPTAVIFKPLPSTDSRFQAMENHIQNFAEKLARAYDLDITKTMWVEVWGTIRVAHLKARSQLGEITLFTHTWRDIRPNEMEMIKPFLEHF